MVKYTTKTTAVDEEQPAVWLFSIKDKHGATAAADLFPSV